MWLKPLETSHLSQSPDWVVSEAEGLATSPPRDDRNSSPSSPPPPSPLRGIHSDGEAATSLLPRRVGSLGGPAPWAGQSITGPFAAIGPVPLPALRSLDLPAQASAGCVLKLRPDPASGEENGAAAGPPRTELGVVATWGGCGLRAVSSSPSPGRLVCWPRS